VMHRKANPPAALPQLSPGAFIVKMPRGIVFAE